MSQRLRLWFNNNKTWIYMVQYIVYSIILLIIVALVDANLWSIQDRLPRILLMKVDLSKTLLTTMAGAFLTISTFTFSTILTVLNKYASSYSPRTVNNFIQEKITMKILGIYIGGFFYSICALLLMRDAIDERQVIAGGVAIVYSVISIIYFVIFVQRVLRSMQGVNVISEIYEEALPLIREEYKARSESSLHNAEATPYLTRIYSNNSGYLSLIDYETLASRLKDQRGIFDIRVKLGDYVVKGFHIADLHLAEEMTFEDEEEKDEFFSNLADCFLYEEEKFDEVDYRFNLDKLVEMTLTALSPSTNDPNTAIHCIRKLALLMGKLFQCPSYHVEKYNEDGLKIFYTGYSAEEDLYLTFYQIHHYGKDDPSVLYALLEALYTVYMMSDPSNRHIAKTYADNMCRLAEEEHPNSWNLNRLKRLQEKFHIRDDKAVNQEVMDRGEEREEE
ncbi:MAG: DUF2254 domain-containing protein [Saccharofermentanales bacterium]|jgi:uncharacterized membrane protein